MRAKGPYGNNYFSSAPAFGQSPRPGRTIRFDCFRAGPNVPIGPLGGGRSVRQAKGRTSLLWADRLADRIADSTPPSRESIRDRRAGNGRGYQAGHSDRCGFRRIQGQRSVQSGLACVAGAGHNGNGWSRLGPTARVLQAFQGAQHPKQANPRRVRQFECDQDRAPAFQMDGQIDPFGCRDGGPVCGERASRYR